MIRASLLASSLLVLTACGAPPPRAAKPQQPLTEGRAHEIILRALRKESLQAEASRDLTASGTRVNADVIIAGSKCAIAYLSDNDLADPSAESLPKKDPKRPTALVIAEGTGDAAGEKILLLFARDYTADDTLGEEAEHSTMSAEAQLAKDVRDFLYVAKSNGWR